MEIRPTKTEADYETALKEVEDLMLAEAGSPQGDRLDAFVTLVEAYERKRFWGLTETDLMAPCTFFR